MTRRPDDFYATPAWVTRAIIPHLPASCPVLDPCAGIGCLLEELGANGFDAHGIELDEERSAQCNERGITCVHGDALTMPSWNVDGAIVMNPPFSLALEFVQRAIAEAAPRRATVAAFLRLAFLESKERIAFNVWHPADVFVLPSRPSFTGTGRSDMAAYAWFLWGPGRGGRWSILNAEKPGGKR